MASPELIEGETFLSPAICFNIQMHYPYPGWNILWPNELRSVDQMKSKLFEYKLQRVSMSYVTKSWGQWNKLSAPFFCKEALYRSDS